MAKRLDVAAPRTYKDRDGNDKTAWTNVGVAWDNDGKINITLHAIPVAGPEGVRLVLMEPKPQNDSNPHRHTNAERREFQSARSSFAQTDLDDAVPF